MVVQIATARDGPLEVGVAAGGELLLDVGGDRRPPLRDGHARAPLDLPLGRTIPTSLLWTAGNLVVFAPLAVRAYRRQV